MNIDWRNSESAQQALKDLISRKINFTEFVDGVKTTSTFWLCLKDIEFFKKLSEAWLFTRKEFSTLLKAVETAQDFESCFNLGDELKFFDDTVCLNYSIFKYYFENSMLTERETIDILLKIQRLHEVLDAEDIFNEPLYLKLNKEDVETLFNQLSNVESYDKIYKTGLLSNDGRSVLHFLEQNLIDYKKFFDALERFRCLLTLFAYESIFDWMLKHKHCDEILNHFFDRIDVQDLGKTLYHFINNDIKRALKNSKVFKKIVDKFTNDNSTQSSGPSDSLSCLIRSLDSHVITHLSKEDLQYMLSKIQLTYDDAYSSLYILCKNVDLLEYCLKNDILTDELAVNFERVMLGRTSCTTLTEFVTNLHSNHYTPPEAVHELLAELNDFEVKRANKNKMKGKTR